eukprot:GHRR01010292.1.p1 GENE.GHRR01010292.1~~GHRR01010292.1.p1  ORF type:complete len:509 (+),score=117.61 GHRR01010292.1:663-2189(+)
MLYLVASATDWCKCASTQGPFAVQRCCRSLCNRSSRMVLPRVQYLPVANELKYHYLRKRLQWLLVAVCAVIIVFRLETPCMHQHKSLDNVKGAQVEFHAQKQGRQLPADADGCAAKIRDVSSWTRVGLAKPPFQFPKIIHQTVEEKYNISCEVLECMQTWKDMNPRYEHRLYDAKDRADFIEQYYPEVLEVYQALSTNVERADLWRYLALHRYGGIYADSDVRCMEPISKWNAANRHDADLLVGVVYTDKGGMVTRVNNFILAAMPCHPVMAAMPYTAMSRIAAAGLAGNSVGFETGKALSEAVIGRTGPAALTATIADFAERVDAEWPVNGTAGAHDDAGNLVGTVRLMPRNIMTMGWETAAEKITCSEAYERNPGAYICHQYFGTWKATYSHRPALTYSSECRYWDHSGSREEQQPDEAADIDNSQDDDAAGHELAASVPDQDTANDEAADGADHQAAEDSVGSDSTDSSVGSSDDDGDDSIVNNADDYTADNHAASDTTTLIRPQ